MTRRPATTLIEVIVTMFIMAIGMLALMVLFPLGALNMGQALKDDRCASTANMAENVAIIWNIRHDTNVSTALSTSSLVYIDPNGVIQGYGTVGNTTIPRVEPSFITSSPLADRWFSLPDDILFSESGTANTSQTGGIVDRGRRYSFAYLARKPLVGSTNMIDLAVVVYSNRPVGSLVLGNAAGTQENTLSGTVIGTNGLLIATTGTTMRRGGWILDTSGNFFRLTNVIEAGGTTTTIEVSPDLPLGIQAAGSDTFMVMDYVAEVFEKGTSWQP